MGRNVHMSCPQFFVSGKSYFAFIAAQNNKLQPSKMSMSGAQERKQALIEHKVITDVLPGNLDLSYDLKVEWPETSLKQAGEELGREETQSEPTLSLSPTVYSNNHRPMFLKLN